MNRQIPVDLPEGYIDFYKSLESWQNEQQIILKKDYNFATVDLLKLLATKQKPLLQIKEIVIEAKDYKKLLQKFLSFISDARPDTAENIHKIEANMDSFDFQLLIQKITHEDATYFAQLAELINIPQELLVFVLDHTLRPFLRILAAPYLEELAEDEFQSWDFPAICPICGSKSHISRLRANDGRRFMFCDRCFMEWEARYLQCIHCGNNEPGSIQYIAIENDDAYQIYTCDKCKGYLKTYDERQTGQPTDLFIANMETIYLDMLAQEKGFTNHE